MSYMTDALERVMTESPMGSRCALIWLDRYQAGKSWGVHLVLFDEDKSQWTCHRTIGLFNATDFQEGFRHYLENYADSDLFPQAFGNQPCLPDGEALQDYIRRSCIPLEWKSMDDAELGQYVGVTRGTVRHAMIVRVS